jgi:AcrR family transcriptional regulator
MVSTEIVEVARRQLAIDGAAALSLRAVARELGMASSAIYRYFPSRDELLTQLIVDAYQSLGDAVVSADAACGPDDVGARWEAVCHALRTWAQARPQEYALVYGSPVPGYEAPLRTVAPAARIPLTLLSILREAAESGRLALPEPSGAVLPVGWREEAERMAADLMRGVPPDVVIRVFMAWSQLFGLVSLELFGHLVGSVDDTELLFDAAIATVGAFVGLPPPGGPAPGPSGAAPT